MRNNLAVVGDKRGKMRICKLMSDWRQVLSNYPRKVLCFSLCWRCLNKLSCLLTILTNVNLYQHLNCHNIHTVSFLYSRTVLPVCKPWWWFSVSPSEKVEYKCFWSDCKCNRREGLWDDNSQCWRNCRERNKGTQMD